MSVISSARTCSQAGCPFPARCLEGFEDVNACPYTGPTVPGQEHSNAASEIPALEAGDAAPDQLEPTGALRYESGPEKKRGSDGSGTPVELVDLIGADSLTMDEVRPVMGRERCQVVLVAGDAKAGKTTLVVELYARFLTGRFHHWTFAGSVTLRALDLRHYTAQAASGAPRPYTVRTPDEEMRLLHLHLARGHDHRHLLFSDVRGEFFDNVIDGAPVSESVPIAPRTDRCIVTIDGERVADPRTAETAFLRAQFLIGGLLAEGGLGISVPIAIVCTKWDQIPEQRRARVLSDAEELASFAGKDGRQVHVQPLSVRPGPPISDLIGLSDLLDWLVAPIHPPAEVLKLSLPVGRRFWEFGGAR